ncbi:MAG: RsmB/NOP family class I SAM-dependent RNA methyltransferase [Actinomycetota bacterium]|nr:RsmB/NOP family class I SAM-dependent RNA methyltransferase [Actinomycetota bacterium]
MNGPAAGVDQARLVAFEVLRAVSDRDAYANLALPAALRAARLTGRDAAFATELAYGTLRGRGSYDAVLGACVDRPLDRLDGELLDALRLGAHQLLAMRVPAHAAVSQTVSLVRSRIGHRSTGLVNAVLRKVARDDREGWLARIAPDAADDPTGHREVTTSHPGWIVEALGAGLEREGAAAELDSLLAAHNVPPTVTLVARPGGYDPAQLRTETGGLPGRWSPFAVSLTAGGDPGAVQAVRDGSVGVQDEGSQLVALLLAAAEVLPAASAGGAGERWLDLCAGPGGKAALLGALAAGRGARLVANDSSAHRARLVSQVTHRIRDVVDVRHGDGRSLGAAEPGAYDRVLVDAPCAGLGALRRRPEARWRRTPADVPGLVELQLALLASGLDATRRGGVLAYATCSPHLAETHGVLERVLASRPDGELLDVRSAVARLPEPARGRLADTLPDGPTMQLWPHRHGTDAMFVALLRRT